MKKSCYCHYPFCSPESEDISANGISTERDLHMTGNSTIQYITQEKLDEALAAIQNYN
jgi:hypothetical protein